MSDKKDHRVTIRLTPEQKKKLASHAKAKRISISGVLQELIDAMPEEPVTVPIARVIYETKSS
jgi:uncharacterized protein (DUF1778 family)